MVFNLDLYENTVKTGKFELRKPVMVKDIELKELDFPISELRGRDIISAQGEFETLTGDTGLGMLETNKPFHAYLASKIAKIPYETVLDMPLRDFTALTMIVQGFLFRGE